MSVQYLLFSMVLLASCTTGPMEKPDRPRIDHVIVGAADLDLAITHIARITGVRPVVGGVHPGRGTRNALMSLGDGTYVEILAPDPAQAIDNDELRELRGLAVPTLLGWAVSAKGAATIRSTLAAAKIATSAVEQGSRAKPDGSILQWVVFGYEGIDDPLVPFFIIWQDPSLHPSRTSPGGCRMKNLKLISPSEHLAPAIAPLQLPVLIAHEHTARMQLSLSCPTGEVQL